MTPVLPYHAALAVASGLLTGCVLTMLFHLACRLRGRRPEVADAPPAAPPVSAALEAAGCLATDGGRFTPRLPPRWRPGAGGGDPPRPHGITR